MLTLPRGGVDLTVTGGFVSERSESASESRWTALGRANQPLDVLVEAQGRRSPRRTAAALSRARRLGRRTGRRSVDDRPRVRVEVHTRPGARSHARRAAGDGDQPGQRRDRRRLGSQRRTVARSTARSGRRPNSRSSSRAKAGCPRDGEVTVPLMRVPAAERETGGVAISVLGAGEIEKHQMRGLEPADVSELADVVAGRESPSMVAFRLRPIGGADSRSLHVAVKRYTPQAVLIANVEEARYRALAAEDGLFLVEAHYAVRNNQRSFLKVTLPPRATIWSASVAGKPGASRSRRRHRRCCWRSRKAAPAKTRRRSSCRSRTCSRSIRGRTSARASRLPALDLPISRTGVELYHSPRFRVDTCSRAPSASNRIRASSPKRCADAQRRRRAAVASRRRAGAAHRARRRLAAGSRRVRNRARTRAQVS